MSYRAANYYRLIAGFATLSAFLVIYPQALQHHLQPSLIFGFLLAGAIVGAGLGAGVSQIWLKRLETKGEMRPSLSIALVLIGTIISLGSIPFFIGPKIPMDLFVSIVVFIMPAPAATFAVISVMFSDWERRNKKAIYGNWVTGHGRLYVGTKTE